MTNRNLALVLVLFSVACTTTVYDPTLLDDAASSSSAPQVLLPPVVTPVLPEVTPVVPTIDPELALIQEVVADENAYREVIGQVPLATGLACTLYTIVPGTQNIVGAALTQKATWAYHGVFNQPNSPASDGLNIIPPALRAQYTNWYKVTCQGYIAVTESQYMDIDSLSDDALIITLDGVKIINEDNQHGERAASGSKLVRKGMRSFKVEYQQGNGSQSLSISKDGQPLPAKLFFR